MKFIANTFFLAILWRRYRRLLIAVGLLIASYFLVSLLHDDYLDYVKNSGKDTWLGMSYAIKWLALLIATVVFYFVITTRTKTEIKKRPKDQREANAASPEKDKPDPFDAIRHKKKLRGRAEQFLDDGNT